MKDIMLIEADSALCASRLKTLRSEGYHVTAVSTADEAARLMQCCSYDLIVTDEVVPDVFEVIMSIAIPTLIMVREENVHLKVSELPMGIWTILVKPFTIAQLKQAVARAFVRANAVKDIIQRGILLPLNNSSKLLVSEEERDRFLNHMLGITAAETEADGVAALLMGETERLTVKSDLGLTSQNPDIFVELGEWVMKTACTLMVNDRSEADPFIKQKMYELGAWSLLVVPLIGGEKSIGAIVAFKTGVGARFSSISLEFVSILAKQTAKSIENADLFKNVEKQREELEKLLERATQSQENERKRVAVEIHDGIGQQLVGALYRIQAFTSLLTQRKYKDATAEAEDIRQLLEKTIGELRQVLAGLHPQSLEELGLTSALRQEAGRFTKETKTECCFMTEGSPSGLTSGQEAAIYRVVQEALNNVRKHAQATKADIKLQYLPGQVSVAVTDNGKGFRLDRTSSGVALGHMGLAGMKERAEILGGQLKISSKPGKGTLVELTIPLTRQMIRCYPG